MGARTLKMAELTTAAGLPRPEIEDAGGCVTIRFRHGHYVPSEKNERGLTRQQQAILALLDHANDGLALREIRARLEPEASERQVRWALAVLKKRGLVVSMGPRSGGAMEQGAKPIGLFAEFDA